MIKNFQKNYDSFSQYKLLYSIRGLMNNISTVIQ